MGERTVICVAPQGDLRARGAASILRRVGAGGTNGDTRPAPADLRSRVETLRQDGRITLTADADGALSAWYSPSLEAKNVVASDCSTSWGQKAEKHLRQSVQTIPGAIVDLPLADGPDALKAFTTDWSPFPAACAVAIHPTHVLADQVGNRPNVPVGIYVRHPLVGDLLPVWTADWVRPEFGTGIVIVNPAHSRVDFEFAQRVGLPVRFGLAPAAPTADPQTWPAPPVIGSGVAVRTGHADGEPADKAREIYLERLVEAGHAYEFTDRVLGSLRVGTAPDADAAWRAGIAHDLALDPVAAQILHGPLPAGSVVVTSTQSVADLVLCRALHIDLFGEDVERPRVITVGNTQWQAGADAPQELAPVVAAVTAKNEDVASVKKQNIEQVERFFENHRALCQGAGRDAAPPGKRVGAVLSALAQGNVAQAFSDLYKIQRDIKKNPDSVSQGDRQSYFAAAAVFGATEVPDGYDVQAVLRSRDSTP